MHLARVALENTAQRYEFGTELRDYPKSLKLSGLHFRHVRWEVNHQATTKSWRLVYLCDNFYGVEDLTLELIWYHETAILLKTGYDEKVVKMYDINYRDALLKFVRSVYD
jgi:hypothetical protein